MRQSMASSILHAARLIDGFLCESGTVRVAPAGAGQMDDGHANTDMARAVPATFAQIESSLKLQNLFFSAVCKHQITTNLSA